jgi:hypothetical protein
MTAQARNETDRFLLLDNRIVERTHNAQLTIGKVQKAPHNPLFAEDQPWEPRFDNLYPNVVYDQEEEMYTCWYSPFLTDPGSLQVPPDQRDRVKYPAGRAGKREMGVCYAVSREGIIWEKPSMFLHKWKGKPSNIVDRGAHGAGIFKDIHERDPARRYKMMFKQEGGTIAGRFSVDGIRWAESCSFPDLADAAGDTHNNVFWAPTLGKYVCMTRTWERRERGEISNIRLVARSESPDFSTWSPVEEILCGVEDHLQIYSMPVFYYHGVYIGLPAIHNIRTDRVHTELSWSPDTLHWQRISPGIPLIANSEKQAAYDWGCVYAAACPVFLENEIRLYYGGSDGTHYGWRKGFFCLATLRPDGFAGYEQDSQDASAVIVTILMPFAKTAVRLSADVEAEGFVITRLLDGRGEELARAKPVTQTVTDARLEWLPESPIDRLAGETIRLEFELKHATLYSFSFQE